MSRSRYGSDGELWFTGPLGSNTGHTHDRMRRGHVFQRRRCLVSQRSLTKVPVLKKLAAKRQLAAGGGTAGRWCGKKRWEHKARLREPSLCGQPEQLVDDPVLGEAIPLGHPFELAFAQHVHGLIALNGPLCRVE